MGHLFLSPGQRTAAGFVPAAMSGNHARPAAALPPPVSPQSE